MRITFVSTIAALGLLFGCADHAETDSTAETGAKVYGQLSAGGGIASFTFKVPHNGLLVTVGKLLVTNGAYDAGAGYPDDTEFWRWDPANLSAISLGSVDEIDVVFEGTSETYDPSLVAGFEAGLTGSSDWTVSRNFYLHKTVTTLSSDPPNAVIYSINAKGWGEESDELIYYHVMDFSGGTIPEMSWYISEDDYNVWARSESTDDDDDSIWEVRLTNDSAFLQVEEAEGYLLETIP